LAVGEILFPVTGLVMLGGHKRAPRGESSFPRGRPRWQRFTPVAVVLGFVPVQHHSAGPRVEKEGWGSCGFTRGSHRVGRVGLFSRSRGLGAFVGIGCFLGQPAGAAGPRSPAGQRNLTGRGTYSRVTEGTTGAGGPLVGSRAFPSGHWDGEGEKTVSRGPGEVPQILLYRRIHPGLERTPTGSKMARACASGTRGWVSTPGEGVRPAWSGSSGWQGAFEGRGEGRVSWAGHR